MVQLRGFLGFWIICAILLVPSRAAYSEVEVAAISRPSADVTLSFVRPGRIAEVSVKEGDSVKPGELLVQQDAAAEQALLRQIQAQSEDTTQIEARKATLDQKRIDLKRFERAAERGSATDLEVDHARLDVLIAELSLRVARFQHEQDIRKYNEAKLRVANLGLKSPIAGRVERVHVETGESVRPLAEVVRVVRTNPLWIDVQVPLAKAKILKRRGAARVRFPGSAEMSVQGRIIYVSTVADAASATLRARIEVPNDAERPAGEHVTVSLGDSEGDQEENER